MSATGNDPFTRRELLVINEARKGTAVVGDAIGVTTNAAITAAVAAEAVARDAAIATAIAAAIAGIAAVGTGTVLWWTTASAPTGYLLCDGTAVSRTTYAALFTKIGVVYGTGDGSTTFNVPNLKGKVVVGFDSGQTEFDALAETGGEKTHVLTIAELATHTHMQDAHSHTYSKPTATSLGTTGTDAGSSTVAAGQATSSTTATNQNTGSGTAHNNLQPYLVLNGIIKT